MKTRYNSCSMLITLGNSLSLPPIPCAHNSTVKTLKYHSVETSVCLGFTQCKQRKQKHFTPVSFQTAWTVGTGIPAAAPSSPIPLTAARGLVITHLDWSVSLPKQNPCMPFGMCSERKEWSAVSFQTLIYFLVLPPTSSTVLGDTHLSRFLLFQ